LTDSIEISAAFATSATRSLTAELFDMIFCAAASAASGPNEDFTNPTKEFKALE